MSYLFSTFFKIGSMAFGGYMALIAVMQKQLVEQDRKLDNQVVLDGISLASILPGPVAVNTVGYVGYHLRGFWGAILSMFAVTLPCFLLVVGFAIAYFEFGELPLLREMVTWVIPAIVLIILSVGINMSRKHLDDFPQFLITLAAFIALQWIGGPFTSLIFMITGATIGVVLYYTPDHSSHPTFKIDLPVGLLSNVALMLISIGTIVLSVFLFYSMEAGRISTELLLTFSSMSLTLFGGGYVIIPIIQETIVGNLHWLSTEEFNAALAISQMTPGPILISAAFIGYKVSGFSGAIWATVGIFLPSGLLMITGSHYLKKFKDMPALVAAFKGLRPAVIGLIFSSAATIGYQHLTEWYLVISLSLLLLLYLMFKPSTWQILLMAIVIGFLNSMI